MKRRSFLHHSRAITVLVASGQLWRAFGADIPEFGAGAAFEPWRTWQSDSKGTLALVHAAILSSNAFNTQPWLFKIDSSRIELYADTQRNLGAFDPYLREMFFSLGCALENLVLAGDALGFGTKSTLSPGELVLSNSKPRRELAALIALSPKKPSKNPLFEAIAHRHTNRKMFDANRKLPAEFLHALANLVRDDDKNVRLFTFTEEGERKALTDLVWEASGRLGSSTEVRRGTAGWYRNTEAQVESLRDGAYVGEPDAGSYVDLMMSGRLFGLIAVRDRYDRPQTMRAGQVWQRAHLLATVHGVAARPANGAVEIIDHERQLELPASTLAKLARITGDSSWQPTFMFYMGYPTAAAVASARRSIADVLT